MADERQIKRIVRTAANSSYGVAAVTGERWHERLAARLGFGQGGVKVEIGPPLRIAVNVRLAPGVPAAQVTDNVAEAVRYNVERDAQRAVDEVSVTVDGIAVPGQRRPPGGG